MWYRIISFFKFYIKAISLYNVQSPFLFDFVMNVLDTKKEFYAFNALETAREKLRKTPTFITLTDYGAGSSVLKTKKRKISDITSTSVSGQTKCRILFNLANHYACHSILELGTSLGISSAYLASANHTSEIVTMEGDPNIAAVATDVHQTLGLKNIQIVTGIFENTLSKTLDHFEHLDLVFIDGHHAEVPTRTYFETIISKCDESSIIVIDDIYWSPGMTQAWHSIISRNDVTLTIDLYDIGIVFFRKELSRQHISYLPYKYKPWKLGLFG
ncbi:MAG: class I SAM-dependent methyltransferase [Saprospiraceae bacterium]|nr:class I SAM-dependent methyltransferase [Saprospiraceae bacterium]MBL0099953.1 class I SAM-dependent methyltransferase [Saprospiraceae bacterium]